jgi:hypothetical protein
MVRIGQKKFHYAECGVLFITTNVVILSVVILSVIMLKVLAPLQMLAWGGSI